MNKRQRKKKWKKETPREFQACMRCGKKLTCFNQYHVKWRVCDPWCYGVLVGVYDCPDQEGGEK